MDSACILTLGGDSYIFICLEMLSSSYYFASSSFMDYTVAENKKERCLRGIFAQNESNESIFRSLDQC